MQGRRLTRAERAGVYGMLGLAGEVLFTAARHVLRAESRHPSLAGHSYAWMLPIYGIAAYLFEPLHDVVRDMPVPVRASAYAAGIMTVEGASGLAIRRATGVIPWDYTSASRVAFAGGAVRLDYAPLWAIAGLLLERVHDALLRVRIVPAAAAG